VFKGKRKQDNSKRQGTAEKKSAGGKSKEYPGGVSANYLKENHSRITSAKNIGKCMKKKCNNTEKVGGRGKG